MNPFQYMERYQSIYVVLALIAFYIIFPLLYSGICVIWSLLRRKANSIQSAALFASVWVVFEFTLSKIPFVFPLSIAITQFKNPILIQICAFTGIYGVSFALIFVNGLLAEAFALKKTALGFIVVASIILYSILGFLLLNLKPSPSTEQNIKLLLVQPNIEYRDAWRSSPYNYLYKKILNQLNKITLQGEVQRVPYTIVWPELSITDFSPYNALSNKSVAVALKNQNGLILGAKLQDQNAILSLNQQQEIIGHYSKQKLVPGFETTLYKKPQGSSPVPIENGKYLLGSFVCLEILFPDVSRKLTNDHAELLGCISFNTWLGHTNWPLLQAAYAPFRAVENHRYLFFLNNHGPSLSVNNRGQIQAELPISQAGYIRSQATLNKEFTPYTRFGDIFAWLCIGITLLCFTFKKGGVFKILN